MTLYHFTDSRNIPSICKFGLLSWKQLVKRKIKHWPASSEQSRVCDARKNLDDYIRCCLNMEHPMAYVALREGRIQDYVWLEIDDIVMQWQATLYSSDNAVASWSIINNNPQTALDSNSIQAEVLIKKDLNPKWIKLHIPL
jgi:hypothetical protein